MTGRPQHAGLSHEDIGRMANRGARVKSCGFVGRPQHAGLSHEDVLMKTSKLKSRPQGAWCWEAATCGLVPRRHPDSTKHKSSNQGLKEHDNVGRPRHAGLSHKHMRSHVDKGFIFCCSKTGSALSKIASLCIAHHLRFGPGTIMNQDLEVRGRANAESTSQGHAARGSAQSASMNQGIEARGVACSAGKRKSR